jgi:hypothetical protein
MKRFYYNKATKQFIVKLRKFGKRRYLTFGWRKLNQGWGLPLLIQRSVWGKKDQKNRDVDWEIGLFHLRIEWNNYGVLTHDQNWPRYF